MREKNRKGFFPCELARKKELEKWQKKILLASEQGKKSERKKQKKIFLVSEQRKKSERKNRKRFSL